MANAFTTDQITAFEDVLMGFEDALTISKHVAKYGADGQLMERAGDTLNRPMPYILNTQTRTVGSAVTTQDVLQRKVPTVLDQSPSVPFKLNSLELREKLRNGQLAKAAAHQLASHINTTTRDELSLKSSLVVPITGAASSYSQVAEAESIMLEQGISSMDRAIALTARDYNGLANDLSKASRSFGNEKSDTAYERSYIGPIAGFESYRIDAGKQISAAAGGAITMDTTGALVQYAPTASADNRTQQITVSSTTSVVAGDAFTVAGLEAVHHITKETTNQAKTFRVVSVDSGTTMTISPPMTGGGGATDAELQYKNIEVASTSATAAITWLNGTATGACPFWAKESIEIMPGSYVLPEGEGVAVMREYTESGFEVIMSKSFSNSTFEELITFDCFYGVNLLNPEMAGVVLFNQ